MHKINGSFELTAKHVADYRRQGFVVLKGLFAPDLIEYMRARMKEELDIPTDHYQKGFDRLAYDMCVGDEEILGLLAEPKFRRIMLSLCDTNLFFTQGVGFGMKKNVSTGFTWHIESQSFGFNRTEDYSTSLWIPLHPIDVTKQRGGMRYVPTDIISGRFMYDYVDPAVFRCLSEKIKGDGIAFADYVKLRDEPLNSSGMNRLLEYYAVEDDFELGDALLFDKFVIHRSVVLEEGPIDVRDAFTLRFISETSRYDRRRATDIEIPRNHYGYQGPTKFHLDICKDEGELIVGSSFFESDRERRRIAR